MARRELVRSAVPAPRRVPNQYDSCLTRPDRSPWPPCAELHGQPALAGPLAARPGPRPGSKPVPVSPGFRSTAGGSDSIDSPSPRGWLERPIHALQVPPRGTREPRADLRRFLGRRARTWLDVAYATDWARRTAYGSSKAAKFAGPASCDVVFAHAASVSRRSAGMHST